ncbi:MAG: chondroitinase family polysaccharide lyase [Verrucomicrobiota bacterium]
MKVLHQISFLLFSMCPLLGALVDEFTDTFSLGGAGGIGAYTPFGGNSSQTQTFTIRGDSPDGSFVDGSDDGFAHLHRTLLDRATVGMVRDLGVISSGDVGATVLVDAGFRHRSGMTSVWSLVLGGAALVGEGQLSVSSFSSGSIASNSDVLLSAIDPSGDSGRLGAGPLAYTIQLGDVGKRLELQFSVYDSTNSGSGEGTRDLSVDFISYQKVAAKYGNYRNSRIGLINGQTPDSLLFFPWRELLYDFDTDQPLNGVQANASAIATSASYYMTAPQSLRWRASNGSTLILDAGMSLPYEWRVTYFLSMGLFQEDSPGGNDKRAFRIELISSDGVVRQTRQMYLHKSGWNILCSELDDLRQYPIDRIRVTQVSGSGGDFYVDNAMVFASQNTRSAVATSGIEKETLWIENSSSYPTTPLTPEERDAFYTIAERVIPLPSKVSSISSSRMNEFRALHAYFKVERNGEFANGANPLYYYRGLDKLDGESDPTLQYRMNSELCDELEHIGKAWYQTQDVNQKEELAEMVTDLVRLSVTYGGIPNPWYNGRGFAEGVFYSKDLLESEGLLEKVTEQIFLQYNVDRILYNEHSWENPVAQSDRSPEFFWQATADDLNTGSKSTLLSILVAPDSPEKARDLQRLRSWLENVALAFSPNTLGTLKPDGSWFHHWGNRFDNYGWVAAWRGSCEWVWWLSHTPFGVGSEAKERMHFMADIHFEIMNKDGYVGPQDAMSYIPSSGFMNLALAGSPDGSEAIDPVMASYWLAYPNDSTYRRNADLVSSLSSSSIVPADKVDSNSTLSYDISNVHRRGDWQVYTRGASNSLYHTQYERDGFLFYNIGGLSLVKEGEATGMQQSYGSSLLLRHLSDLPSLTPGYNTSRAPGVTSIDSSYNNLRQIYYQRGSSDFVGGLSTFDGMGIFVQEFDARDNSTYSNRIARGLRFKKSYFYFGDDIVMLASNISNNGSTTAVETGLLQEPTSAGNRFLLSNGTNTGGGNVNVSHSSADIPWIFNETQGVGVYLTPGQSFRLFKGPQTFGPSTGDIVSAYLHHSDQSDGWYECVLRLNANESSMVDLASSMDSGSPEFSILRRDSKAHVVRSEEYESVGYAIFDSSNLIFADGVLASVDQPCVVMVQEHDSGLVNLTVSCPDKKMQKTASNPLGWSDPVELQLVLNGAFGLEGALSGNPNVAVDYVGTKMLLRVTVQDGLPQAVSLRRVESIGASQVFASWNFDDEGANGTDSGRSQTNWSDSAPTTAEPAWILTSTGAGSGSGISVDPMSGELILSGVGGDVTQAILPFGRDALEGRVSVELGVDSGNTWSGAKFNLVQVDSQRIDTLVEVRVQRNGSNTNNLISTATVGAAINGQWEDSFNALEIQWDVDGADIVLSGLESGDVTIERGGFLAPLIPNALLIEVDAADDRLRRLKLRSLDVAFPMMSYLEWVGAFGIEGFEDTLLVADFDGDGYDNRSEYIAMTDPASGGQFPSVLQVASTTVDDGLEISISWIPLQGRVYDVYGSTDLRDGFSRIEAGLRYPIDRYTWKVPDAANHGFIRLEMRLEE